VINIKRQSYFGNEIRRRSMIGNKNNSGIIL
jgi:hypothetical protein